MGLSIIIINWNTKDLLAQCLGSIFQDLSTEEAEDTPLPRVGEGPGVRAEVFVVDNASTDGSGQMVRECFPWVQLIENRKNVGFACANNQAIQESTGVLYSYACYEVERWPLDSHREVDIVQGACMILRWEALNQVGRLDEDYFIYSEEVDLCHRLRQHGCKVYWVPQAAVVHHCGQTIWSE